MNDAIAKVNGTEIKRSDLENAIQGYAIEQLRKTADQLSESRRDRCRGGSVSAIPNRVPSGETR